MSKIVLYILVKCQLLDSLYGHIRRMSPHETERGPHGAEELIRFCVPKSNQLIGNSCIGASGRLGGRAYQGPIIIC